MDRFRLRAPRHVGGALLTAAALVAALWPAAAQAAAKLPPIRHVFVIVLENKGFTQWHGLESSAAPYLSSTLPAKGALLPDWYGIGHASLDNYVALVSGQPPTADTKNDCPDPMPNVPATEVGGIAQGSGCVYPANFHTVADQLVSGGFSWRAYQQGIPAPCSLDASAAGGYARKHNPFVFFQSLRDSGQCAANDLGLDELSSDLATASTTPNFSFITPDQCHDGHTDCDNPGANLAQQQTDELSAADGFLKQWVPKILASPAYQQDGLLAILFDEGIDTTACCGEPLIDPDGSIPGSIAGVPGLGGGQTGAVILSPFVRAGTVSAHNYNHYSFLRTVENLFGLSYLGEAQASAAGQLGADVFTNWGSGTSTGTGTGTGTGSGSGSGSGSGTGAGSGTGSGTTSNTGSGSTLGSGGGSPSARCTAYRPVLRSLTVRRNRRRLRISGRASERRCASRSSSGRVRAVFVTIIGSTKGKRCRFVDHAGRLRRPMSCRRPIWLLASGGARWHLTLGGHLPRGRYLVGAIAVDDRGRGSSMRRARFRVR